jgi:hypothetical protein
MGHSAAATPLALTPQQLVKDAGAAGGGASSAAASFSASAAATASAAAAAAASRERLRRSSRASSSASDRLRKDSTLSSKTSSTSGSGGSSRGSGSSDSSSSDDDSRDDNCAAGAGGNASPAITGDWARERQRAGSGLLDRFGIGEGPESRRGSEAPPSPPMPPLPPPQRGAALVASTTVASGFRGSPFALAQSPPPDKQVPLPTVDKNLVIKGENFGRIFERFRPQVEAYLKEIEDAKDYANWKVPPSKSFEQKE